MRSNTRPVCPAARLAAIGALAAVALTGCGDSAPTDAPSSASVTPTTLTPVPTASPTPDVTFGFYTGIDTLVAAGGLAVSTVPDGTLFSIELDESDAAWETQVVTSAGDEHDVDISLDGTTIIAGPRHDTTDAEDRSQHQARIAAAEIGFAEAARLMLEAVPGGAVRELSLDTHAGKTVWEGDVFDSARITHDVHIDATDGTVLRNEPDD